MGARRGSPEGAEVGSADDDEVRGEVVGFAEGGYVSPGANVGRAVGIAVGSSTHVETQCALQQLLRRSTKKLVPVGGAVGSAECNAVGSAVRESDGIAEGWYVSPTAITRHEMITKNSFDGVPVVRALWIAMDGR